MNYKKYKPITDQQVKEAVERELRPIREAAIKNAEAQVHVLGALRYAVTGVK